jgi:hypothetical protein
MVAAEQTVMLETLRGQVRVVRVYRRTPWIAPVTTDLTLSVAQIIQSALIQIKFFRPLRIGACCPRDCGRNDLI